MKEGKKKKRIQEEGKKRIQRFWAKGSKGIHILTINTPKDVDLLVQSGILVNWLRDSKAAAHLINNLCINITVDDNNFYFFGLCDALNECYETPMHKRKAILRRDYFNTPWKTASTIAVFVLLLRSHLLLHLGSAAVIIKIVSPKSLLETTLAYDSMAINEVIKR
ncbi:hypothetical protein LguiB_027669 [Lonicera macranthoides]